MNLTQLKGRIDELYDSKSEQSDETFRVKVINILYEMQSQLVRLEAETKRQPELDVRELGTRLRKRGF